MRAILRVIPKLSLAASIFILILSVMATPYCRSEERDLLLCPDELQGKVAELRMELNSGGKKEKSHSAKKIALKKIVANMTMSNNDMVALFPDVVSCMNIPSLEIKKM